MSGLNIQALEKRALDLWEDDKQSAKLLGAALIAVRDALENKYKATSLHNLCR